MGKSTGMASMFGGMEHSEKTASMVVASGYEYAQSYDEVSGTARRIESYSVLNISFLTLAYLYFLSIIHSLQDQ